ncbi:MAG: NAD(P)H-hydrate dehydratase, partial [Armatimonadetes bacterium]|nr:NAD(P)H-hydrate dehydratase [Candidatus Hippobium faecium]
MILVTGENIKTIDNICLNKYNIPTLLLMENAGRSIYEHIAENTDKNKKIAVICGKGNNGGDGLVAARHFLNNNFKVSVFYAGSPKNSSSDVQTNFLILQALNTKIKFIDNDTDIDFSEFDIILDALLGIGIIGEPKPLYKNIINAVNNSDAYVYSADIPSGVNGTDGKASIYVKANETLTLGYPKIGLFVYPGKEATGKLTCLDISLPNDILENISTDTYTITENDFRKPERYSNSHKGTYGHVGIIGGKSYMTGAGTMAALSAFASGCGYVSIASPYQYMNSFSQKITEAVMSPIYKSDTEGYNSESIPELIDFSRNKNCLILGPGLGKDEVSEEITVNICKNTETPLIIDADGIYSISKNLNLLKKNTILTPHPKEMTYLTGLNIEDIQNNRIEVAKEFAKKYNIILVLKGADTVTTDGNKVYINNSGCNGMAVAGSGDVLSGIIGGFAVQMGINAETVAGAVYLHGKAGEKAQKEYGFGMKATD